jgi:hypothetical protein
VLTELPEEHRIEVVVEVARSVARALPAAERRRPEARELRDLVALPAAPAS